MFIRSKLVYILVTLTLISLVVGCGVETEKTQTEPKSKEASTSQKNTEVNKEKENVFYQGQDLEFLVPFGTGGGTDTLARFLAPYLNKYIEGNPAVQVVNVPGGGSIIGANEYVDLRKHDGYHSLLTSGSTTNPYLLGESAVRYDFKEMKPIVGFPDGGVVYASPSTGITGAENILNSTKNLVYAGISATGLDIVTLLSFEVLELNVQAVLGYDGKGASRVAFEQGESNIDYQTTSAYLTNVIPLVEEGKANPLFAFGHLNADGDIIRDPAFPDIPSLKEFYVEVYGKDPSGPVWEAYKTFAGASYTASKVVWVHGDTPPQAVDALREGAKKMANTDEFKKDYDETLGGYHPYFGDNLEKMINSSFNVSSDVKEWVYKWLADKYDVTIGQ
jgi:tripartite-type tricarboxylate transporter receptor subunit TctC